MSASIHHIARAIVELSTDNQAHTHTPSTRVTTTIAADATRRGHRRRRDDAPPRVGPFPRRTLVFAMPLASPSHTGVVRTSFVGRCRRPPGHSNTTPCDSTTHRII